jgi:hypothetical protein
MRKQYEYLPQEQIDSITTTKGKVIESEDILDGAHIKLVKRDKPATKSSDKKSKRWDSVAKNIMKKVDKIWDDMDIQSGSQIYADENLQKKYIAKLADIDSLFLSSNNKEKTLDYLTDWNYHNVRAYLELKFDANGRETYKRIYNDYKNTLNPDLVTPVFKKGGTVSKTMYRSKSLNEKAEELVGSSTWNALDAVEKADTVDELVSEGVLAIPYAYGGGVDEFSVWELPLKERPKKLYTGSMIGAKKFANKYLKTMPRDGRGLETWDAKATEEEVAKASDYLTATSQEYAKGGGVAEAKYKVTFEIDGNKKEKTFDSKEKADSFVELMSDDEDVRGLKLEEVKEAKKTESLFGMAKTAPAKAASKKEKESVQVNGIASDIARYDELKEIINNAKAEQELIGGSLKQMGKQKFLELYERRDLKPDNFNLSDADEKILFIVMDKYKKVEPEKASILESYDGLLETTTTYSFNPEVLERIGATVSKIIMESKLLSDEDKRNLLISETTTVIKKGSIDRLMQYDDPAVVFDLIEPILALK